MSPPPKVRAVSRLPVEGPAPTRAEVREARALRSVEPSTPSTPSMLDPTRRAHREIRRTVQRDGEELPRFLFRCFEHFNAEFFGGRLELPVILITTPGSGRALGDYQARDVHGLRSVIRLSPAVVKRGLRRVLTTLLHEMVHAYCWELLADAETSYRGHGPKFTAECNRIGEILGFPPVAPKGRGALPSAQWPHLPPGDDDRPAKAPKAPAEESSGVEESDGESPDPKAPGLQSERYEICRYLRHLEGLALERKRPVTAKRLGILAVEIWEGRHLETLEPSGPTSPDLDPLDP